MPRFATCDISKQKKIPLTVVVDEEAPRPVDLQGWMGRSRSFTSLGKLRPNFFGHYFYIQHPEEPMQPM